MKKNDVFEFTAPNGVEIEAVAIEKIDILFNEEDYGETICGYEWLCYSPNMLFTVFDYINHIEFGKFIVDYAILPDYDKILEDYQHQLDTADDYADKTL